MVAVLELRQGGECFGVGFVPAAAVAFQALGSGFATGFSRSAANLPGLLLELWIVDHVAAVADVIQQTIRCGLLHFASQR